MLQGRSMSMPPVAIILSLLFWGWVRGVAGALLAIPLTASIVIVCEHFKSTEWISNLLGRREYDIRPYSSRGCLFRTAGETERNR